MHDVAVRGVVEGVARDLGRGGQHARDGHGRRHERQRGQQAPLQLRGDAHPRPPARPLDRVAVRRTGRDELGEQRRDVAHARPQVVVHLGPRRQTHHEHADPLAAVEDGRPQRDVAVGRARVGPDVAERQARQRAVDGDGVRVVLPRRARGERDQPLLLVVDEEQPRRQRPELLARDVDEVRQVGGAGQVRGAEQDPQGREGPVVRQRHASVLSAAAGSSPVSGGDATPAGGPAVGPVPAGGAVDRTRPVVAAGSAREGGGMPNRLAASSSPYLLQHADNPVDWWEWGAGGVRRGPTPRRAGAAQRRLRRVPLVPRHGGGVLRGRGHGGGRQRPLRRGQGRPGGAAGRRRGLHARHHGPHPPRRLADDGLHDPRRAPVPRRHVLPAHAARRHAVVHPGAPGRRRGLAGAARRRSRTPRSGCPRPSAAGAGRPPRGRPAGGRPDRPAARGPARPRR